MNEKLKSAVNQQLRDFILVSEKKNQELSQSKWKKVKIPI